MKIIDNESFFRNIFQILLQNFGAEITCGIGQIKKNPILKIAKIANMLENQGSQNRCNFYALFSTKKFNKKITCGIGEIRKKDKKKEFIKKMKKLQQNISYKGVKSPTPTS